MRCQLWKLWRCCLLLALCINLWVAASGPNPLRKFHGPSRINFAPTGMQFAPPLAGGNSRTARRMARPAGIEKMAQDAWQMPPNVRKNGGACG